MGRSFHRFSTSESLRVRPRGEISRPDFAALGLALVIGLLPATGLGQGTIEVAARAAARADGPARAPAVAAFLAELERSAGLPPDERLRWAWTGFLLAERDPERARVLAVAAAVPDVRARMLIGSFREFTGLRADYQRADRAHTGLLGKQEEPAAPSGRRKSPKEVFGPNSFDAPHTEDTWSDPHGWVGRWTDGRVTVDVAAYPFGNFAGRLTVGPAGAPAALIGFQEAGGLRLLGSGGGGVLRGGEFQLERAGATHVLRRVPVGRTHFERRPAEARVLLGPGTGLEHFRHSNGSPGAWKRLADGSVEMDPAKGSLFTRETFGDVRVYLEFRHAYNSESLGPRRGNSGLYLANAYEIQLVDSFGGEAGETSSGSVYHLAVPRVNACAPPLEWQSLEVDFRAARFDGAGRKTASARLSAWMNGDAIHVDLELPHPTAASLASARKLKDPVGPQPLLLQSHGNVLQFRHLWVRVP